MREITTHKGNELDDALTIRALNEPGHGGACHHYVIDTPSLQFRVEGSDGTERLHGHLAGIAFQEGPVKEHGVNGISIESLLAICIDRLEGFQSGPYRNGCNEEAMAHLKYAMTRLKARTAERQARGVEGTSTQ